MNICKNCDHPCHCGMTCIERCACPNCEHKEEDNA